MTFSLNKPFETSDASVTVDAGLKPGSYRFRLVVVDTRGLKSAPAEVVVSVVREIIPPIRPIPTPVPVPGPIRPTGPVITPIQ